MAARRVGGGENLCQAFYLFGDFEVGAGAAHVGLYLAGMEAEHRAARGIGEGEAAGE
jgi:hypothetical protein